MGTAIRATKAPKKFAFKFNKRLVNARWTEDETVAWIKSACVGSVWFMPIQYENARGSYSHHEISFWFAKRQDAMMFRLEYML